MAEVVLELLQESDACSLQLTWRHLRSTHSRKYHAVKETWLLLAVGSDSISDFFFERNV